MPFLKPAFSVLSPAGGQARLSILIFHRVLAKPDAIFPGEADVARFDCICRWLRQWFNVLPLDQAVRRLGEGTLPSRAACITFDDGYADNHDLALPILLSHGLTATFFIATGFLEGGRMFNDSVIEIVRNTSKDSLDLTGLEIGFEVPLATRSHEQKRNSIGKILGAIKYFPVDQREELTNKIRTLASVAQLPTDLMMSHEQVRALRRAGMGIGAHTVSHPILARQTDAQARREISLGKQDLEDLLGEPIKLFAYPNGKPSEDYSAATVKLAREAGFDAAVTTAWGAAQVGCDLFQLPRFTPWDRSRGSFGLRLARNLWSSA